MSTSGRASSESEVVNGKNCQCFTKSAYHENQQVFDVDPSQYVLCLMQGNNLSLPKYRQKAPVNYLPPATVDHVIHAFGSITSLLRPSTHWQQIQSFPVTSSQWQSRLPIASAGPSS